MPKGRGEREEQRSAPVQPRENRPNEEFSSSGSGGSATLTPTQAQSCTVTVNSVEALQQALKQAQSNNRDDVICIQAGNYLVTSTLTYSTPNGDGGKKLTIRAVGGEVVLDGNYYVQMMRIETGNNDTGADVTIDGIRFQNGKATHGGGLYVKTSRGNITLTNNTFSNNAGSDGGGAYARLTSGSVALTNNTFSNNAGSSGGGAYASGSSVNLTNNTFNGNKNGGAYALGYRVALANNIFSNNTGGGAYVSSYSGTVVLTGNTFFNNTTQQNGGGAYVSLSANQAIANIYNNIFWQNTANTGGRRWR
ncbi:MAG: right-handed parallel beta-helix repeat-containing protein [Aquificaceae bacterium]|nr:right-handed parallel beta-helix repeat-containing protein [Aquificaceae bacterium]